MKTVSITDIEDRVGQLLAESPDEPIRIEKDGLPVAVLVSWEEYEFLRRSDEFVWGEGAHAA